MALVLSLIACTHNEKEPEAPVTETTDKEQETEKEQESGKEQEPDGADTSEGEESPETEAEKEPENNDEPETQDGDTEEQDDPETNSSTTSGKKSEEEKIAKLTERNIDPDKPMVALTFDDGPSPDYTEKILDLLAEHGAVATFFEVGNIAKNYPDLIRKELEYGCEVGSHTYSHANLKQWSDRRHEGDR